MLLLLFKENYERNFKPSKNVKIGCMDKQTLFMVLEGFPNVVT